MSKLLSVKEVCQLTGLNRKLLYLYKDIVKPSGYKNVGYEKKNGEWCDGHKQYDEKDIVKLQQISIFEKLRIDRVKIKEKMSAANYDSNKILDEQIAMLRRKKKEIEELIETAELMRKIGINGEASALFAQQDMSVWGKKLLEIEEKSYYKELCDNMNDLPAEEVDRCTDVLNELAEISEDDIACDFARECVRKLKTILVEHCGVMGWLMLVSISLSGEGEGTFIKECISYDLGEESEIKVIAHAISNYLLDDLDVFWKASIDIIVEYADCNGLDFTKKCVKKMVSKFCELLQRHFGIKSNAEFQMFFDMVQDAVIELDDKYIRYAFDSLKFYCT